MKAVLSELHVTFAYEDITKSIFALKTYCAIRDTSPAFDSIRGQKDIGIPLLVVDGVAHIIEDPAHARDLVAQLQLA